MPLTDVDLIQHPAAPQRLVLLFHGVGGDAHNLRPLAHAIAEADPHACVVSVRAPHPCDLGAGYQWFSVRGVTEENRPARVSAALPEFIATVRAWQQNTGIDAADTALVGFSQGAIMALAAGARDAPPALRIIALAGRFATLPTHVAAAVRWHLVHGTQDNVMPLASANAAASHLRALGATPSLDIVAGLGHGIDTRVRDLVLAYLAT
ncbi:MAG: esterase [Rhodocyclaceae bacterium]